MTTGVRMTPADVERESAFAYCKRTLEQAHGSWHMGAALAIVLETAKAHAAEVAALRDALSAIAAAPPWTPGNALIVRAREALASSPAAVDGKR